MAAVVALIALLRPAPHPAIVSIAPSPSALRPNRVHRTLPDQPWVVVYVVGAVAHPGLYRVAQSARADDAIRRAGGFTRDADRQGVNLAERLDDGEEVVVPKIGDPPQTARRSSRTHGRRRSKRRDTQAPQQAIDLNHADAAALSTLPGIGDTLAQRIVAYRAANGPFASTDELLDVAGMTQSRVDAISPYLTIGTPK